MVRHDDDFLAVPDSCVCAEFPFKNADGARTADIVGHQNVGFDPDIIAGFDPAFARRPAKIFSVSVIIERADYLSVPGAATGIRHKDCGLFRRTGVKTVSPALSHCPQQGLGMDGMGGGQVGAEGRCQHVFVQVEKETGVESESLVFGCPP